MQAVGFHAAPRSSGVSVSVPTWIFAVLVIGASPLRMCLIEVPGPSSAGSLAGTAEPERYRVRAGSGAARSRALGTVAAWSAASGPTWRVSFRCEIRYPFYISSSRTRDAGAERHEVSLISRMGFSGYFPVVLGLHGPRPPSRNRGGAGRGPFALAG